MQLAFCFVIVGVVVVVMVKGGKIECVKVGINGLVDVVFVVGNIEKVLVGKEFMEVNIDVVVEGIGVDVMVMVDYFVFEEYCLYLVKVYVKWVLMAVM